MPAFKAWGCGMMFEQAKVARKPSAPYRLNMA